MQKSCVIAMLALLLQGCASFNSGNRVRIADGLVFDLLPPSSFGQHLMLTQVATIDIAGQSHELLVHTELAPQRIAIAGLLPGGVRVFSIVFDGLIIVSDGDKALLSAISPAYFLADLQLSQWPLPTLRAAFAAANTCFVDGVCTLEESDGELQRNLQMDGTSVISIRYGGMPHYQHGLVYEHHERAYRLQIETLGVEVLDIPARPESSSRIY